MQNLLLFGGNNQSNESGLSDQQGFGGFPSGGLLSSYFAQQQQDQQRRNVVAQAAPAFMQDPQRFSGISNGGMTMNDYGAGIPFPGAQGFMSQGLSNQAPAIKSDGDILFTQKINGGSEKGNDWIGNMTGEGDPYAENGILGPWSATSAGLLGNLAVTNQEKGKKTRKKPKDKPKRPLSAYNIFFKEERHRILEVIPESDTPKGDADGSGRKRKKRPHGKIGFESLAKVIGQRWQELTTEKVNYYKLKADEDMQRYKKEMEQYITNEGKKEKAYEAQQEDEIQEAGCEDEFEDANFNLPKKMPRHEGDNSLL